MSELYKLDELPLTSLVEGAKSRLIIGDKIMVSFIEMDPGMKFPIHKHNSEQIMIVLEGSIKQKIGEKEVILQEGDVLVMESNLIHGGEVSIDGCKAIDIFVPPREDYSKLITNNTTS